MDRDNTMSNDGGKSLLLPRRQDLSGDEIEEILVRLPAKQILRCKLLSKPYYELIKSPRFINKHSHFRSNIIRNNVIDVVPRYTNGGESINGIAYLPPSQSSEHLHVPTLFNKGFSVLSGSCNGLLCAKFTDIKFNPPQGKDGKPLPGSSVSIITENFVLWNPATRDHIILPAPTLGYNYNVMGLGYDATTDNYKLVKIHSGRLFSNASAEFWSMKASCWRKLLVPEPVFFESSSSQKNTNSSCGVFVRGNLYWLASNQINCGLSNLLVFDIVNNRFRKQIPLPDDVPCWNDYNFSFVSDFMGLVAFVNRRPSGLHEYEFDVWVLKMDDDDYSWAKQLSIEPLPAHVVPAGRISMNGMFLFRDKSRAKEEEHFWYDTRNKERKELRCTTVGFSTLWNFTESLVPLTPKKKKKKATHQLRTRSVFLSLTPLILSLIIGYQFKKR